jgi:hypothetical protein
MLIDSFAIPKWMRHSPIANNWEEFNKNENNGELNDKSYLLNNKN